MTMFFPARWSVAVAVIAITFALPALTNAQQVPAPAPGKVSREPAEAGRGVVAATQPTQATQISSIQIPDLASRTNIGSTLQFVAILSVVSLAPAILLMLTSFTRMI